MVLREKLFILRSHKEVFRDVAKLLFALVHPTVSFLPKINSGVCGSVVAWFTLHTAVI